VTGRVRGRIQHNKYGPHRTSEGGSYVDPVAVQRAVDGDRSVVLSGWERDVAILIVDAEEASAWAVAHRIGVSDRTVHRSRRRWDLIRWYLVLVLRARKGAEAC
jgi:hypothetical protein